MEDDLDALARECFISASQEELLHDIPGFRDTEEVQSHAEVGLDATPSFRNVDEDSAAQDPAAGFDSQTKAASAAKSPQSDHMLAARSVSQGQMRTPRSREAGSAKKSIASTPDSCSNRSFNGAFESDRSQSPSIQQVWFLSAPNLASQSPSVKARDASFLLSATKNAGGSGSPAFDIFRKSSVKRGSQSRNEATISEDGGATASDCLEFSTSHLAFQTQVPILIDNDCLSPRSGDCSTEVSLQRNTGGDRSVSPKERTSSMFTPEKSQQGDLDGGICVGTPRSGRRLSSRQEKSPEMTPGNQVGVHVEGSTSKPRARLPNQLEVSPCKLNLSAQTTPGDFQAPAGAEVVTPAGLQPILSNPRSVSASKLISTVASSVEKPSSGKESKPGNEEQELKTESAMKRGSSSCEPDLNGGSSMKKTKPGTVTDLLSSWLRPCKKVNDFSVAEFSAALRKVGYRLPPFTS